MILVILVIGILMVTLGIVLYDKLDYGKDKIGKIFQIIGTVATIISTIVTIVLLVCVLNRVNIDKKIAIYEEENTKIEQQPMMRHTLSANFAIYRSILSRYPEYFLSNFTIIPQK